MPLLSTAFCPPIEYFALLAEYSSVYIEACESYAKQSWRNRCRILSANGPLDLTVPVVHGPVPRLARPSGVAPESSRLITAVRVDYSTPWVAKFKRAVESAYFSSPFFIYYKDALWAILDSRPATLWELNRRLLDFFCTRIGIAPQIIPTADYRPAGGKAPSAVSLPLDPTADAVPPLSMPRVAAASGALPPAEADYREAIHPKRPNTILADLGLARPYWQVFRDRYGFVDGLSVMDLQFNEGPESLSQLRRPLRELSK